MRSAICHFVEINLDLVQTSTPRQCIKGVPIEETFFSILTINKNCYNFFSLIRKSKNYVIFCSDGSDFPKKYL